MGYWIVGALDPRLYLCMRANRGEEEAAPDSEMVLNKYSAPSDVRLTMKLLTVIH